MLTNIAAMLSFVFASNAFALPTLHVFGKTGCDETGICLGDIVLSSDGVVGSVNGFSEDRARINTAWYKISELTKESTECLHGICKGMWTTDSQSPNLYVEHIFANHKAQVTNFYRPHWITDIELLSKKCGCLGQICSSQKIKNNRNETVSIMSLYENGMVEYDIPSARESSNFFFSKIGRIDELGLGPIATCIDK